MALPPGLAAWKAKQSKGSAPAKMPAAVPPGKNTTKSAPLVAKVVQPPTAKVRDPHQNGPKGHMSYKQMKP